MVRGAMNHPSVILWGFLNEAETDIDAARPLIAKLTELIHRLDPSRPVTFATMFQDRDQCVDLVDVVSFNIYPGWYPMADSNMTEQDFEPEDIRRNLLRLEEFASSPKLKEKAVVISEIGAEALPGQHDGLRWSEEYQSELLQAALREVIGNERFSGILLWMFCDTKTYSNGKAQERARGYNNKGMLDEYRRPKISWGEVRRYLNPDIDPSLSFRKAYSF